MKQRGSLLLYLKKQNKTHSQQMFQHPPKPLQTQRCGHHSHEFSGRLMQTPRLWAGVCDTDDTG